MLGVRESAITTGTGSLHASDTLPDAETTRTQR